MTLIPAELAETMGPLPGSAPRLGDRLGARRAHGRYDLYKYTNSTEVADPCGWAMTTSRPARFAIEAGTEARC